MLRIGLTGNVASGKSTVAETWRRLGAHVIDADELARRAVEPGSPALARIAAEFGSELLDASGALDRALLRRRVFDDAGARRRLEEIVHPEVARLRAAEEAALAAVSVTVVVHEIPLLFEAGLADEFDILVFVDAPRDVRLERLVRERGLTRDEAQKIIAAQMPAEPKRARANVIVDNDGSLQQLGQRAEAAWRELERTAQQYE